MSIKNNIENQPASASGTDSSLVSSDLFRAGEIVTVPIKNRWGVDCAATIESVHKSSVDATVWNMDGPGADRFVTGIPFSALTPSK